MEISVSGNLETIVIGAAGREEIVQNVAVILSTIKGSVPLDRTFGVDPAFLDRPMPVAQALLTADIAREVEKQEPRVKVTSVKFDPDPAGASDGVLKPNVWIVIKDGV